MSNKHSMPVILLTKAVNTNEVIFKTELFLNKNLHMNGPEPDFFILGGHYSDMLAPLRIPFIEKAKNMLPPKNPDWYTDKELKNYQCDLQGLWEEMGGEGEHTLARLWDFDKADVIIPLIDCFNIVKNKEIDIKEKIQTYWLQAIEEKAKEDQEEDKRKFCWSATKADLYSKLIHDEFIPFEHRVYDIDTRSSKSPKMMKDYLAAIYSVFI